LSGCVRIASAVADLRVTEIEIEIGVAGAPRPGEQVSGDLAVVEQDAAGTLLAVVDGVGHGPHAHRAASVATEVIRRMGAEDLPAVMAQCHEALVGTRGAAVTLAVLSARGRTLTWLGVGTVDARLLNARRWPPHARASLRLRSGTLGHDLPALTPASTPLEHGDLVVLATDGVHGGFGDALDPLGSAQEVAERILADHGRGTDDALVAVARYLEARP
jgi:hypothetical protein